jgi:GntR family transcriptional repressor for pyruvate dehydrogenase complex
VLPRSGSASAALAELRERKEEILQTLEFRGIVESHAAALAAKRRHTSHLEELEEMQERLLKAKTLDEARQADTAFHAILARASGNELLEKSIEDARVLMFGATDQTFFEFRTRASYEGHGLVLEAIRAEDSQAAAEKMREHVATTVEEFEHLIADS